VRLLALGLAMSMALVASARAQPGGATASEADRLFGEGRALAKAGKFEEACERFERSFELDPATGTSLNLADCQEREGHPRKAWEMFTSAAEHFELDGDTARAKFARDRASAVASKLATIVVHIGRPQPKGLAITIAGRSVQPTGEIRELVDPGAIEVTASAPDRVGFVTAKQAAAGAEIVIELPDLVRATTSSTPTVDHRSGRITLAWGFAGLAGASAISGIAFTLVGRSHYNTVADDPTYCSHATGTLACNDTGRQKIHDAQRLADIGTGFAIGCAALAAASAVIYFTAPHHPAVKISPAATAQSVGLVVGGTF
jgi:hypothetical protein